MIFGRDRVFRDDFSNCHDEIDVACVDFIGRRSICGLYLKGEGCFWEPYKDNDFGSSLSSSMVAERNSRSPNDDSAAYVVPDDATANILSAI